MSNTPSPSETQAQPGTVTIDTGAPQQAPAGTAQAPGSSAVGDGVMVGNVQQPAIVSRSTVPGVAPQQPAIPQGGMTPEMQAAIEAARAEEREKLYGRLNKVDEMETQLQTLTAERQAALDAQEAAARAAAEAQAAKEREEMDLRTRLQTMEQETQQRFQQMEEERQRAEAMLEQERRINLLQTERSRLLAEHQNDIIPQLVDFVVGNTPEELQQSLAAVLQRSAAIQQDVQESLARGRQQMPGVSVSGAPGMPLEQQGATLLNLSAEQIRAMDPATYAQYQAPLKDAARRQFYGQ